MNNSINIIEKEIIIQEYIKTMDDKTIQAMNIAKDHLGSSFDIEKSVGFNKFYNNYNLKNNK